MRKHIKKRQGHSAHACWTAHDNSTASNCNFNSVRNAATAGTGMECCHPRPPCVAQIMLALSHAQLQCSPLHCLRKVIGPDLDVHNVEPVAVMAPSRLHSEVKDISRADVHAPLYLLPVRLRVRVRIVCALQQGLHASRPVGLQTHRKVHSIAADGPHLHGTCHMKAAHAGQALAVKTMHMLKALQYGVSLQPALKHMLEPAVLVMCSQRTGDPPHTPARGGHSGSGRRTHSVAGRGRCGCCRSSCCPRRSRGA